MLLDVFCGIIDDILVDASIRMITVNIRIKPFRNLRKRIFFKN